MEAAEEASNGSNSSVGGSPRWGAAPDHGTCGTVPDEGLIGDRWERGRKPSLGRQLTLMDHRVAKLVGSGRDRQLSGDNVLVDLNLSEDELTVGGGLILGEVRLRLTDEPHLGCKIFAQRFGPEALKWVNWQAHRSRRLRGVNCQVLVGGVIKVGDRLVVER